VRVVVDTNTLASGAVAPPGGTLASLVAALRDRAFELVLSEHILDELARTLAKQYFTRRISLADSQTYQVAVARHATLTPITATVQGVATHPEDDLILAAAVSASADYLVTGDRHLQRLGAYEGVAIVSPAQFVAILSRQS
jgi:putative PIN family toxin of toxin-antitoxin system